MSSVVIEDNKVVCLAGGKVSWMEVETNYSLYTSDLKPGFFSVCTNPRANRVYVGSNDNTFHIFDIDTTNKDNWKFTKLDFHQDFNFNNPFIFITGHSGGGTSIIVKFLKKLGIHFGEDSGDLSIRKPHEAAGIRNWWDVLTNNFSVEELRESFKTVLGTFDYQPNKLNAFKLIFEEPDDRGIILGEVFPNLKVVSIIKPPSKKPPTTHEGTLYRNKDPKNILITQLIKLEGTPVFHLDWYKFFLDYEYANKLLNFIGYYKPFTSQEEFNNILKEIDFNLEYLKEL